MLLLPHATCTMSMPPSTSRDAQAILDAAPRSASVHTAEPCKLLLIRADYGEERNGDRFRDFLHLVPDFKARLREIKKVRRQQTSLQEMMKVADAGARAAAEVH